MPRSYLLLSCADRVEIIANDQGNRTTPSYVGFTDTERLIGDAAKNQVRAAARSNTQRACRGHRERSRAPDLHAAPMEVVKKHPRRMGQIANLPRQPLPLTHSCCHSPCVLPLQVAMNPFNTGGWASGAKGWRRWSEAVKHDACSRASGSFYTFPWSQK